MAIGKLATAFVDIEPNLRPLHAGLSQARTAISSFARGAGGQIPLTIALGASGISLGGLVAGLGDAALKAAKLQEALSKVKITFGKEGSGVLANVDELSEKFGIAKREAADAAAEFGLLAKAAGMSAYEQARFAKEFNQIAIDLASFHVTTRPEAVLKLMSGLEGMARPLRQFGIFIDEASVKAEASALGMRKHNEELTDEQKILVRSILIRKQAGVAIGDAERSLSRPFEQIKKFWGDLENAQAEFGKNLQGALVQSIGLARELGETLSKALGSGAGVGEGAEAIARTARFAVTPASKSEGLAFTSKAFASMGAMIDIGLRSMLGLSTEDAKRRLAGYQGGMATQIQGATEPGLAGRMGPATPEELRKMWLKASEEMAPEVKKSGGDFLFKIQNKLTDWIALHLKEPTDPFGEFKENIRGLGRAIGPMLLGKGAGGLPGAAGAMAGGFMKIEGPAFEKMKQDRALELLGLKKTTQPSQMFAEPEEFARHAITGVLSGDPQKEQVKLLEEARDQIKEFKDKVIEAIPRFGRWAGLFPRG